MILLTNRERLASRATAVAVAALVTLMLLPRVAVLVGWPGAFDADPDGYRALAENVRDFGTFGRGEVPTAYRPPLYSLVLAPFIAIDRSGQTAVGILHFVLGVATVGLTYHLGRRWDLGRWAWLAAALVAVDPILLVQSTQVMTETLATFLAVAAICAATRVSERASTASVMAAGLLAGLATLCRPTFLPWMAMLAVVLPIAHWRRSAGKGGYPSCGGTAPASRSCPTLPVSGGPALASRSLPALPVSGGPAPASRSCPTLRIVLSYSIAAVVVLAPWVARNVMQFGRPIVSTTHGGYTLLLANNPSFYEYLRSAPSGSVWWSDEVDRWWFEEAPHETPEDELAADRLAYRKAQENIHREPGMFLYSCAVRVGRLWSPLPHQISSDEGPRKRWGRYAVGAWYVAEFMLAATGLVLLVRRRKGADCGWLLAFLLAASFTAVHAFYWTDLRMRAPLMPAVALAAAAGAGWVARRISRSKSSSPQDLRG